MITQTKILIAGVIGAAIALCSGILAIGWHFYNSKHAAK